MNRNILRFQCLHPPIIWHLKGLFMRDSVSGVLSANMKPSNSLTLLNMRTDVRRTISSSWHLNPVRWYAYTEATEGSPAGGGLTVLRASSLSTYCCTPLQSPTLRCQRAQSSCHVYTLSLPAFVWTQWLDDWRGGTICGTSFRGLIIAVRFWSTVSCERTFNDVILSDFFVLKTYRTVYVYIYMCIFMFTRVTSNYSELCYI